MNTWKVSDDNHDEIDRQQIIFNQKNLIEPSV